MTGTRLFTIRLVVFFLLCGGLLFWALHALGAFTFAPTIRVEAVFGDASGLLVGSVVTVSGVEVGKVTAIGLTESQEALVSFTVRRDLVLPRDVEAVLRSRSLLGEKGIALGPAPTDGERLSDGDRLHKAHREPDLMELASRTGGAMEALGGALDGLDEVAEALGAFQDEMGSLSTFARRATQALDDHDAKLGDALTAARQGADSLGEAARSAEVTLKRIDEVLDGSGEQGGALEEWRSLAGDIRVFLDRVGPELEQTAQAIRQVTGVDEEGAPGSLGQTAARAEEFFGEASKLSRKLEGVAGQVEASLRRLDRVTEALGKFDTRELRKILQEEGVRVNLLE